MSLNTILATAPLATTGFHLKATGTTIGNSLIWDNGTNVGIGNTNTSYTLDVSGTGRFTSTLLVSGTATFSGFVGINGSPATGFPLEAYINSATAYSSTSRGNVMRVYNSNTSANIFAGIELGGAGTANDGLAGLNAVVTGSGSAALTFYTRDSNTFAERMRITSAGNVGIANTAPIFPLHISASYSKTTTSGSAQMFISTNEAAASNPFGLRFQVFGGAAIGNRYAVLQTTDYNSADGGSIVLQSGGGNVGIGTSTPSYLLDINGMARILRNGGDEALRISNDNGYIGFFNTANSTRSGYLQGNTTSIQLSSSLAIPIQFLISDAEKMRISSAGNVAIGNTSASQPLHVTVAAGAYNTTIAQQSNLGGFVLVEANSSGSNSRASIVLRGNDLIGGGLSVARENPTGGWQTYMTFYANNVTGGAGVTSIQEKLRISSDGSLGANGSTTNIYNASDRRLKQNITPINYGLDAVLNMKPISFNWADGFQEIEKDKTMLGFIAQDMEKVVPEVVEKFSKTPIELNGELIEDSLTINQKYIIPILVKAIQEMNTKLDEQNQTIQNLQEQINILAK